MSAVLSDCRRYRYRLERDLPKNVWHKHERPISWIMVNPSTADAEADDPTIRRCASFTQRMGGTRLIVGNLFALRTAYVSLLARAEDPVGPENDRHLREIMHASERIIVAWGASVKVPPRLRDRYKMVVDLAAEIGCPLFCLGTAQDGHPRHPLMLAADAAIEPWSDPWALI